MQHEWFVQAAHGGANCHAGLDTESYVEVGAEKSRLTDNPLSLVTGSEKPVLGHRRSNSDPHGRQLGWPQGDKAHKQKERLSI